MHPLAALETKRAGARIENARQWRAELASLHKLANGQTGWWRMQSHSNPSLPANCKMQGDFAEMQGERQASPS